MCILIIPFKKLELLRFISFSFSIILFVLSLCLWVLFDEDLGIFQFTFGDIVLFDVYCISNDIIGVDGLSIIFLLLTTFLFVCCFLLVWSITHQLKLLLLLLFLLEFLLLLLFSTLDIFLFYIVFELILLPMVLIIFIWGSRARKIKAGFYFFLYTLLGSLFMLIGLLLVYSEFGTTNIILLTYLIPGTEKQILLWFLFFFSFAIKIPMFPFHIWLPAPINVTG